jgi:hypothetical protein
LADDVCRLVSAGQYRISTLAAFLCRFFACEEAGKGRR